MKFPRHARIFRGHLDATPFAAVFFCLLIFIVMASLTYTPGVLINLPDAGAPVPGIDGPTVAVAVDANGVLYYRNQIINETNLLQRLKAEAGSHAESLTLIVQADRTVSLNQLNHLRDIARQAGVKQLGYAVLPRVFDSPAPAKLP